MEYRKIISFGKSSFVVSLPKTWVRQNKLGKGDLIYFDELNNNLLLQPKKDETVNVEKEITILVDGKEIRRVQREIISAYIQNYKTIILQGNEIKEKAKAMQSLIQNLVAMEILEQDSKKIVAKDFLNINDISLIQILRKMDVITKSMMQDCIKMFKEDNFESIYHRDNDVNKFRFLMYRITWYATEGNSMVLKKLNATYRDIFNYWWLAYTIESVADHVKRMAKYMKEMKLSLKEQKVFEQLLTTVSETYSDLMKSYYTANHNLAHEILQGRFKLMEVCDEFYQRNKGVDNLGYMVHSLKSLIENTSTIGRIVYEGIPG